MAEPTYDLRALWRAVGASASPGLPLTAPTEREAPETPVEMIDESPRPVDGVSPLEVAGFVDGVQSTLTLTHRDWRPVHLVYVAAAALGEGRRVLGLRERLVLLVSRADVDWAQSLPGGVPVVSLDEESPFALTAAGVAAVGGARDALERALVSDLLGEGVGTLVVDGSLIGRPASPAVVGVAKTIATRYLEDESVLLDLPEGWRSPRFTIPAGVGGGSFPRASCYLRLSGSRYRRWDHGLVRLEASDPAQLDALGARCRLERQGPGSLDPRGDRHLTSVATVEAFLRARRPAVFALR